ncbi:MAG: glycosyltransferase family 2 protein, partial [Ruminococcaceae bacterium]|nr:glycosyltransferase family 2 protein [Oscillospiraceae bacterium]
SGRGTISFRMYPEGFLSLFEGWTKNFASGATATRPLGLSLIILWICSGYSTMTLLIKAILSYQVIWLIIAVLFYLLYAVLMGRLGKRCGQFPLFLPLFYPILLIFFTLVFIRSLIQTRLLHTVRWRGRKIRL